MFMYYVRFFIFLLIKPSRLATIRLTPQWRIFSSSIQKRGAYGGSLFLKGDAENRKKWVENKSSRPAWENGSNGKPLWPGDGWMEWASRKNSSAVFRLFLFF